MILIFLGAGLVVGVVALLALLLGSRVRLGRSGVSLGKTLPVSEELARALATVHPDVLIVFDKKGQVLDCRGPTLADLGQSPEWFIGKALTETIPPQLASEILDKVLTFRTLSEVFVLERVWTVRGVDRVVEIRVAQVNTISFLAIVQNMSSFHRTWQDDRRQNRSESMAVLAGGLAHDLNNCLAVIQGFLSLTRVQLEQPDRALTSLDKAAQATRRAAGLTAQLQALADGHEVSQALVSVRELAEEAAKFALVGSPCLLSLETGSGPWTVEVDPEQLKQVFRNLVLNAVQAMPRGGTVTLAFLRQPGDRISVSVIDEGSGIPADLLPRIFDPHFSTRPQGTGLGLSVAHEIVVRLGGLIEVESREGHGTTFTVFLPAVQRAQDPVVESNPIWGPLLNGHRVLIMEDEGDLRELLVEVTSSLGMDSQACRNGRDAVAAFDAAQSEGRPFSLVVSDLLVPGDMGGREMISQLRSRTSSFRALAVTGFSTDRFIEDFHHQGFDVIISKPFTVDELKNRIVELMKNPWITASTT